MKTLFKGGTVINVFTGQTDVTNVLIENERIIGVGDCYTDKDADVTENVSGKYLCPGFIDGHIHIESTMMTPAELSKVVSVHGTTSIVADPHEIANVCGTAGIKYILESSENIPLNVYIMLPSCVPATKLDESGAVLSAEDLKPLYSYPRVLGLAEMMNYPGVIADDGEVMKKINDALSLGLPIDGHAPLLGGRDLDKYISAGIKSDHECSGFDEAKERIQKGQWIMIRQGTSARNLDALIDLFDEPYCRRCLLVVDDKHAADLLHEGHIDCMIRTAVKRGKSVMAAIQMATLNTAQCFGIRDRGAIAPGYCADILVLDDLESVSICDVYSNGKYAVKNKEVIPFEKPWIRGHIYKSVRNSFYVKPVKKTDFYVEPKSDKCRIINVVPGQLFTESSTERLDFSNNNGIDTERDILKIAVIERHTNTGHIGIGYIKGIGLKSGAICSSVSHDSHNIVVIGTSDAEMAAAVNRIIALGGGSVCVDGEKVSAELPLPIGGLMSDTSAEEITVLDERLRDAIYDLGVPKNIVPLMTMAFVSLPVIPSLKITTKGLVDVYKQEIVPLFVD